MAAARMQEHGRGADLRHLSYPQAGHVLIPYPPSPPSGVQMPMMFDLGGSPAFANAAHLTPGHKWSRTCDLGVLAVLEDPGAVR